MPTLTPTASLAALIASYDAADRPDPSEAIETTPRSWTLPTGTTNRHRWHKSAVESVKRLRQTLVTTRELTGVIGITEETADYSAGLYPESEHCMMSLGLGTSQKYQTNQLDLWDALGELHGWAITRENADQVAADAQSLYPTAYALCKVSDTRKTQAETVADRAKADQVHAAVRDAQAKTLKQHAAILAKAPANAQAAIVAELDENDSDPYTDYFAHKTTRRVVIGWRTGKREDFRQLRAAASNFPETAHLGTGRDTHTLYRKYTADGEDAAGRVYAGHAVRCYHSLADKTYTTEAEAREAIAASDSPDGGTLDGIPWVWAIDTGSIEHRENYSMGAGNYLKAGGSHSTGWRVSSVRINRERGTIDGGHGEIEDGLTAPTETPDVNTADAEPVTGNSYAIETHYHTKRGHDFYIVVPSDRLDRDQFDAARASSKRAGGWYSRKWGQTPGGFAFTEQGDAIAWAAQQFDA